MTDVVVVGAGILGASTADALIARGHSVTLVDHRGTDRASDASLGWLSTAAVADDEYAGLRSRALTYWRARVTGRRAESVAWPGSLAWDAVGPAQPVQGDATSEPVESTYRRLRARDINAELLSRDDAVRIEPALARVVATGPFLRVPGDGYVDLGPYVEGLLGELAEGGTDIVRPRAAATLARTPGGIEVRADGRRLAAPGTPVVLATGAGTPALTAALGVPVPGAATAGTLVLTRPVGAPAPTRILRTWAGTVRPAPGGRLAVHARTVDAENVASAVRARARDVLAEISSLLGLAPIVLDRVVHGVRPVPADGLPVVGALAGLPDVHVLYAHSAATLGPLLGDLLAAELTGDRDATRALMSYRPGRLSS